MTIPVYQRIHPLRRPKGFEPTVQRWSVAFPSKYDALYVRFYAVQAPDEAALESSPFFAWIKEAIARPDGPIAHDHARHVDAEGFPTHVVATYWLQPDAAMAWRAAATRWWHDPARLSGPCGYFREELTVPLERQETLYWPDYPAALSASREVSIYPTPYCGYYGAMRDRIPLAAVDALAAADGAVLKPSRRATLGATWRIKTPHNLAVIRSAAYWGKCDDVQREHYFENLRGPLDKGMDYLKDNPIPSGCCSMRFQQTCDTGGLIPETHALAYFLSLSQMEQWAERHSSHHAIFSAAMARYRKYGASNQLRTWHEVYVLPEQGQCFEYVNCHPTTGLLPYFEGERMS